MMKHRESDKKTNRQRMHKTEARKKKRKRRKQ